MNRGINFFWFRRDLRLDDNKGLLKAVDGSVDAPLQAIFIFDPEILGRLKNRDDRRVQFIYRCLLDIHQHLAAKGSGLLVFYGPPAEIWDRLTQPESDESKRVVAALGLRTGFEMNRVFANHDYEPSARERDERVQTLLQKRGVRFESFKDQVIFENQEVVKDDGLPYTVFTPYSKKWRSRLVASDYESTVSPQSKFPWAQWSGDSRFPTMEAMGFKIADQGSSSEWIPPKRVETRLLLDYAQNRNTPGVVGTTKLGLHLRFGTVSIRRLVETAIRLKVETWLSELIWREFFMQILANFPHVATGPFRPEYGRIVWRNNEAEFARWCQGLTGVPIVDAGMRELVATGFMHNRVRMIAASYLVKHLLIDWRWGEEFFAQWLLDFDLAANNGNWQWVAGCGCDAAPYFRVFNPELQTEKFDPDKVYIKKWAPEYLSPNYPAPMVEHRFARIRALAAYAAVKDL